MRIPILMTVLALLAALVLAPVVRACAMRFGLVDQPDGRRKLHGAAMPLGGGVVVLLAMMLTIIVGFALSGTWRNVSSDEARFLAGLFCAAVVLCAVGLVDDRIGLRGRQKLLGQLAAVGILVVSGLEIQRVQLFDWRVDLGLLAVPFTLFWLLGAVNALNLLDGIDGLASSLGIILSVTFAGMAWLGGHQIDALLALTAAGALSGFLYFNFPPAKMFLGDAGSMLIGLLLGALAIRSSLKGPATVVLSTALAAWAIPIFDVSMAIVRRKLTGRSIYATDRCHLHHCLLRRGFSHRKTLLWIGALCAVTAASALASVYRNNERLAVFSALAITSTLVVTRFFGYAECLLLGRRVKSLALSMLPRACRAETERQQFCTHLQGTREWDGLWRTLTDFAERFDLNSVQLNVNLPAWHEEYHASWKRRTVTNERELWSSDIPLSVSDLNVGRLKITGSCDQVSVSTWMQQLIAGLKPVEARLQELVADLDGHRRDAETDRRPAAVLPLTRTKRSLGLTETKRQNQSLAFGPARGITLPCLSTTKTALAWGSTTSSFSRCHVRPTGLRNGLPETHFSGLPDSPTFHTAFA